MSNNREDLEALWTRIGEEVNGLSAVPETFKPKRTSLPSMRVRKIMNAESFALWLLDQENPKEGPRVHHTRNNAIGDDPTVKRADHPAKRTGPKRADHFKFMFSGCSEAVMLKAAEVFIRELTVRAYHHTKKDGRKILQQSDVRNAVNDGSTDMFDFLIDIIPRTEAVVSSVSREQKQNHLHANSLE